MRSAGAGAGVVLLGLIYVSPAAAHPDGAPWGSADPQAKESCASCHFDSAAVMESNSITFSGGGRSFKAGQSYSMVLIFEKNGFAKAGFLVSASAGTFSNPRDWKIEIGNAQARSSSPQDSTDGRVLWDIEWHAPETLDEIDDIIFHLAVNAANDDASPLGDEIHFRTFKKLVLRKDTQPSHPGEGRDTE